MQARQNLNQLIPPDDAARPSPQGEYTLPETLTMRGASTVIRRQRDEITRLQTENNQMRNERDQAQATLAANASLPSAAAAPGPMVPTQTQINRPNDARVDNPVS
jgi:hypothetical protein